MGKLRHRWQSNLLRTTGWQVAGPGPTPHSLSGVVARRQASPTRRPDPWPQGCRWLWVHVPACRSLPCLFPWRAGGGLISYYVEPVGDTGPCQRALGSVTLGGHMALFLAEFLVTCPPLSDLRAGCMLSPLGGCHLAAELPAGSIRVPGGSPSCLPGAWPFLGTQGALPGAQAAAETGQGRVV